MSFICPLQVFNGRADTEVVEDDVALGVAEIVVFWLVLLSVCDELGVFSVGEDVW